jgi:ketosteroid isomerase-like protein
MSHENVDVVRRLVWDGVDAPALIRDDATWTRWRAEREAFVEPGCAFAWIGPWGRIEVTGLDEMREFWLDWFEPWESVQNNNERIIPVGDEVVVLARQRGRMAGTKHEVEAMVAGVYLVRDGKLARADFYSDRAEALEAVGLRE